MMTVAVVVVMVTTIKMLAGILGSGRSRVFLNGSGEFA